MIAKKNSRVDLERKRIVLFQIGLLTAGSFTLAAFNYSTATKMELEKKAVAYEPVTYFEQPTEEKKIEIPVVKSPVQNQKPDEPSIDLNNQQVSESVSKTTNTKTMSKPDIGFPTDLVAVNGGNVEVNGEDIEPFPPTIAEYFGGVPKMQEDIGRGLVYPEIDVQLGNEGTVYVSFIVEKDGSVSNVQIERGISETIDREAKRIVKEFPKWKPAENAYGKVRTIVRLPIRFIIQ
jgi:protein TonB